MQPKHDGKKRIVGDRAEHTTRVLIDVKPTVVVIGAVQKHAESSPRIDIDLSEPSRPTLAGSGLRRFDHAVE
ncbi:MAG: hypothetical protein AAF317_06490 [Pseudomonadota bacterium]